MENKVFNSTAHKKDISKQNVTKKTILSVAKIKNPKYGSKTEIQMLRCYMQETTLHKKMKFSIKDYFSTCDQILSFMRIWSHLLKKSLMENFVQC